MFPVTDFSFVFCGFATLAATVGYACTRKLTSAPLEVIAESSTVHTVAEPSVPQSEYKDLPLPTESIDIATDSLVLNQSDLEKPLHITRKSSLKRKSMDDDHYPDAGYPQNLYQLYPNKRSKTPPPVEPVKDDAPLTEERCAALATPAQDIAIVEDVPDQKISTATLESTAVTTTTQLPISTSNTSITPDPLPLPITRPSTPSSILVSNSTGGFAAFANSRSSFSSPGTAATPTASFGTLASPNGMTSDPLVSDQDPLSKREEPERSLPAPTRAPLAGEIPTKTTYNHVTGEEDEDVEMELKGVKLFIKRGNKPFSDGMIGHIKLLSNKTTLNERLVFRREPLWKVSMNVRLSPTVRCAFEADEKVLRLILQEPVEQVNIPPENWSREIVVYALKPGRLASKKDFRDFAAALVASASLQPRP